MNVLVAKNIGECTSWTGTAIVIDVLRSATTVCALLAKGERNLVVCPDVKTAEMLKSAHPAFAVMSELQMPVAHEDDSPYLAEKISSRKPVLLVSQDTGKALQALRRSSAVLLGGFCNFRALVQSAQALRRDVLLVPATIFSGQENEEDMLCAQAFKEFTENISMPGQFIEELKTTVRLVEFSQNGPQTAAKDLEMGLTLNGFSVVPQATYPPKGNWAVCVPLGKQPDPAWATAKELSPQATQVQEPQFKTMVALNLRPMVEKTLLASQLNPQPPMPNRWMPSVEDSSKPPQQPQNDVQDLMSSQKKKTPPHDAPHKTLSGLKGFFSGIIRSVKEEKESLKQEMQPQQPADEETKSAKKVSDPMDDLLRASAHTPQTPTDVPAGPAVTRSVLRPAQEEPENEETPADGSGVSLSDGTTTWEISKPRPGLAQANAEDSMFMDLHPETDEQPAPQPQPQQSEEKPITQDPRPERPQERVLELSVLKQGGAVVPQPAVTHQPSQGKRKKAVVLFSGGLDSTTCLYWALAQGYECEALTVSYGQRHLREVVAAQTITRKLHIKHHLIDLRLPWLATSSLVDENKPLPDVAVEQITQGGIPSTYVPGRNLMFLSMAGSLLDAVGADAIVAGPNAVDFSGYPDCTPAFFKAAGEALNRGTRRGVREGIDVLAPLMHLSKADIVRLAVKLQVPLEQTWSCYAGGDKPCGKCDSCKLRAKGFAEAGLKDPAL